MEHASLTLPMSEPTSRRRGSWCLSLSRTWSTAASPREIWAVREDLWTRLSTTQLSTRALTLKLPTNTRRWTEHASLTLPMSGPPSSLGLMSVQAVSQICRRQLQQWDQSALQLTPVSTLSSSTAQESTTTTTAAASSLTTEFWPSGTGASRREQSKTIGWSRTAGALTGA